MDLIYRLEGRLIDLEVKVAQLEKALAEMPTSEPAIPEEAQRRIAAGEHPVRPNHISAIERGQTFGLKTARRLSEALNVPASVLF
jgi:predicted component of type VI protein secretion system